MSRWTREYPKQYRQVASLKDLIVTVRAELRSEINSQVFGLPPELIGMIGSHLKPLDLWSASCASHYLHGALVGNRSLWTNIDCANPILASTSLDRAPVSCLLNVSIPGPDVEPSLLQSLVDSAERIEALSVHHYSHELGTIFNRAKDSMKTLEINNNAAQIPSDQFHALESLTIRGNPPLSAYPFPHPVHIRWELEG